jgi:hypothetical protein
VCVCVCACHHVCIIVKKEEHGKPKIMMRHFSSFMTSVVARFAEWSCRRRRRRRRRDTSKSRTTKTNENENSSGGKKKKNFFGEKNFQRTFSKKTILS